MPKFFVFITGILLNMMLAVEAFGVDVAKGQILLDKYTAPEKLGQPFLTEIRPFTGTVTEQEVPQDVLVQVKKIPIKKLEVKAFRLDEIYILEIYKDNGKSGKKSKKQPLFIDITTPMPSLEWKGPVIEKYVNAGIRVVLLSPHEGEYGSSPLENVASTMETVSYVDRVIEYYNTVNSVDATRFALSGASRGGTITFCYVAHGSYRPRVISTSSGILNFDDLRGPKYDFFDGGTGAEPVMSEEQQDIFGRCISPIQWPEKFKDVYVLANVSVNDELQDVSSVAQLEAELKKMNGKNYKILIDKDGDHGGSRARWEFEDKNILPALQKYLLK